MRLLNIEFGQILSKKKFSSGNGCTSSKSISRLFSEPLLQLYILPFAIGTSYLYHLAIATASSAHTFFYTQYNGLKINRNIIFIF